MRRKAFTLSELLVAMGLMVALLAGAGVVFRSAVQAQRTSIALSEIMRKFRGITDQLDADFRGLRKDGEIAIFWSASADGTERFDRVVFFADGDFQTYKEQPIPAGTDKRIAGNLARVCYMLARNGSGVYPQAQPKEQRILSRTQHIMTGDDSLDPLPELTPFIEPSFRAHNFTNEYDSSYGDLSSWKNIPTLIGYVPPPPPVPPLPLPIKEAILSIITGIDVSSGIANGGAVVDHGDPASMHMFLCDGIGEFKVQGWGVDIDGNGIIAGDDEARWFPEVDPDGDGDLSDSDFYTTGGVLDATSIPGVIYPGIAVWNDPASPMLVTETNFLTTPGLGRALKFTFSLYDSRGIYKNGKTFTHIVWLDN